MAKKTEPIRVGIVGLGRAGWGMHMEELKGREKKFQIVAACDPIKARRDATAKRYGCAAYKTVEELIADENVELVDIASRSPEHTPQALAALKGGKHVFLEKPIALSYPEAKKLRAASAKAKGQLHFRHNRRFEPCFQHVREIIDSGILGEIQYVKLCRNSYSRRDDWQTLMKCGGGMLLNWGPHIIDHALRLLGAPVAEQWSDLRRISAVGDAEDTLKIVLRGTNGRVVDLQISGGAALSEPVYVVIGSKGALRSQNESEIELRYLDPKKKLKPRRAKSGTPEYGCFGSREPLPWIEKTIKTAPKAKCQMTDIWDHLYASIREGKKNPVTLDEALGVMEVISKARKGTPFAIEG